MSGAKGARLTRIGIVALRSFLVIPLVGGAVFVHEGLTPHVMAQAKSEEKTLPVIDIKRVLTELHSIPVGKIRNYLPRTLLWSPDPEDIYMEDVLSAITYLVAKQMGLESYLYPVMYTKKIYIRKDRKLVDVEVNTGLVRIEGEFGEKLWEILEVDLRRDGGMLVEHRDYWDFSRERLWKMDEYRIMNAGRDIDLILKDFLGGKWEGEWLVGGEWGIMGLTLTQYSSQRTPQGVPYTAYNELFMKPVRDGERYKFIAVYTKALLAPDGTVVSQEEWEFIQGNPKAVYYRKIL